jgi:hypothetical protein
LPLSVCEGASRVRTREARQSRFSRSIRIKPCLSMVKRADQLSEEATKGDTFDPPQISEMVPEM